jgi:hypothetical protein
MAARSVFLKKITERLLGIPRPTCHLVVLNTALGLEECIDVIVVCGYED